MRSLSLWMRAHPMAGDGLIAAILLLPELLSVLNGVYADRPDRFWLLFTSLLLASALVIRRRAPLICAMLALLGLAAQMAIRGDAVFRPIDLAICLALYTLVAEVGRRQAAVYTGAVLAVGLVWSQVNSPPNPVVSPLVFVYLPLCWVVGEWIGARKAYHAEVEQRLRRLEFEQDQRTRLAVAEERNRIAREIHDVLAHSVNVMVTQADGAAYALRSNQDLADQALRTISSTGRDALGDVRDLLGVLRNPDESVQDRSPQPTLGGLRELTERIQDLGLPVRLSLSGELDELPTGLSLGVYRIVRESLTNALKHGGREPATARVDNTGDAIEVEVRSCVSDASSVEAVTGDLPGGNGLIGMSERAAVYGGTLHAGPESDGRWRVFARFPLADVPDARRDA